MVKATPSIPLDRLSGSKAQLMIGLSKLVETIGSAPLMAMPCHWFAEVASWTFSGYITFQIGILSLTIRT